MNNKPLFNHGCYIKDKLYTHSLCSTCKPLRIITQSENLNIIIKFLIYP